MKLNWLVSLLIVVLAAWRVAAADQIGWANFVPMTALAFCLAVYIADRRWWLVPIVALVLSDFWLHQHFAHLSGAGLSGSDYLARIGSLGLALGIGAVVARRRNVVTVGAGAIGASLLFYIITNTTSWLADPFYVKSAAGWWQALTVGHPEHPPTLWFFRNALVGDLLFTGAFAAVAELTRRAVKQPRDVSRASS